MSYGLSCIVSDIPANREVDLSEDRYFKPGDIDGMAAKLGEFVGRPLSRDENDRQIGYVRESFDWKKIAEETLEIYKKVKL